MQYYGWHIEPNGDCYIAMEMCIGGSVATKLRKSGRFDEQTAGRLVCETTMAVTKCLQAGITLKEIKPCQLLMTKDFHVKLKLGDFNQLKIDNPLEA